MTAWFLLLCMALNGPSHHQLHLTSEKQAALLSFTDTAKLVLFAADGKDQSYQLDLGDIPFFRNQMTPQGEKNMPVFQLLGYLGQQLLLFHVPNRQLTLVDLDSGKINEKLLVTFPVSPKQIFQTDSGPLLMATLITQYSCDGEASCAFFHELDTQSWTSKSHFGEGKSFQDSFMKSDIPVAFYMPKQNKGGIYYTKTHDLHRVEPHGEETILKTEMPTGTPALKRPKLFEQGNELLLLGKTQSAVMGFVLQGNRWVESHNWDGNWFDFILLGERVILVEESGNIVEKSLK